MHGLQLVAGALLLYLGAEWFVGGASALALALRVPQLLVGLTVVAYGTSAPEIVVGIEAAGGGYGDVALGNVLGSNIANVGLILGCAAVVRPASVDATFRRRELPVLLLSAALVPALLLDGSLSRAEGFALVSLAVVYTSWMIAEARTTTPAPGSDLGAAVTVHAAQAAGGPMWRGLGSSIAATGIGLAVLLVGGTQFVAGAVAMARAWGLSERLVGLTIVAVGTSLPELVTSVLAARRGHSALAVGNVVGSNIFNVLLCLGAAAITGRIEASVRSLWPDLAALAVMTLLLGFLIRRDRVITRAEGASALTLYAAYMLVTLVRG